MLRITAPQDKTAPRGSLRTSPLVTLQPKHIRTRACISCKSRGNLVFSTFRILQAFHVSGEAQLRGALPCYRSKEMKILFLVTRSTRHDGIISNVRAINRAI